MTESRYTVVKNASGKSGKTNFVGMYFVDYLSNKDCKDHLTYPITIKMAYGNGTRAVTETLIILERKVFSETYKGIEKDGDTFYHSEGNYANRLRENLEELLHNGKLPFEIKGEIAATFKKEKVKA